MHIEDACFAEIISRLDWSSPDWEYYNTKRWLKTEVIETIQFSTGKTEIVQSHYSRDFWERSTACFFGTRIHTATPKHLTWEALGLTKIQSWSLILYRHKCSGIGQSHCIELPFQLNIAYLISSINRHSHSSVLGSHSAFIHPFTNGVVSYKLNLQVFSSYSPYGTHCQKYVLLLRLVSSMDYLHFKEFFSPLISLRLRHVFNLQEKKKFPWLSLTKFKR